MPVEKRALVLVGAPLLDEEATEFDSVEEAIFVLEEAVFTVVGALIEDEGPIGPELLALLEHHIERFQRSWWFRQKQSPVEGSSQKVRP